MTLPYSLRVSSMYSLPKEETSSVRNDYKCEWILTLRL
jgi:hypothetical protein